MHLQAAKRILRYLKGTINYGIFYKKNENKQLIEYTDSDYAGDIADKKSTSGYVFMLSGSQFHGHQRSSLQSPCQQLKQNLWQQEPVLAKQYGLEGFWRS
jgi:hypothetical protein